MQRWWRWLDGPPVVERILRRVGVVMLLSGVVDLLLLVTHITIHTGYQANWWLPGTIGGVLLIRGNLLTAAIARQAGAFCAAAAAMAIVTIPFLQPLGLLAARTRQQPIAALSDLVGSVVGLALLIWIVSQLSREVVQSAMVAARLKRRGLRVAVCGGCGMALVVLGLTTGSSHSAAAAHARFLAEEQAGPTYRYFVRSLNVRWVNGTQSGGALVDAWNDRELRHVAVEWPDRSAAWSPTVTYDPAVCQRFSVRCADPR